MLKSSSFILKPVKNSYEFSHYLAGLIEGDGTIIVPAKGIISYTPYFEIVFHIEDQILAEYVQLKIGGNFRIKENYCVLIIKSKDSVLKVINLINGKMRTPKIEALHRMINWLNLKYSYKIPLLDLDHSPINNNSWLSGYIDADGSFYLNWLYDLKGKPTSLQYYMRISQRQIYHRDNLSYLPIMSKISKFLSVPLRKSDRKRINYIERSYEVRSGSYISNYIILSYLLKYPLFSYKFKAVPVQIVLLQLSKSKEYKLDSGITKLLSLKEKQRYQIKSNLKSENYYYAHMEHILKYFPF